MFYEKPKRPNTTAVKCVVCGEKLKDFELLMSAEKTCLKCKAKQKIRLFTKLLVMVGQLI